MAAAGSMAARAVSRVTTARRSRRLAGLGLGVILLGGAARPDTEPIRLVASREGFKPSSLSAKRGDPVRLAISSSDIEHCFAIDAFRVEKRIRAGKATALEFTPDRAGAFPFYCCLEPDNAALRGTLTVTD